MTSPREMTSSTRKWRPCTSVLFLPLTVEVHQEFTGRGMKAETRTAMSNPQILEENLTMVSSLAMYVVTHMLPHLASKLMLSNREREIKRITNPLGQPI